MRTADDLMKWLSENGFDKYHTVFMENDVDSIELVMLLTSDEPR
jgi:hypothetical protein